MCKWKNVNGHRQIFWETPLVGLQKGISILQQVNFCSLAIRDVVHWSNMTIKFC